MLPLRRSPGHRPCRKSSDLQHIVRVGQCRSNRTRQRPLMGGGCLLAFTLFGGTGPQKKRQRRRVAALAEEGPPYAAIAWLGGARVGWMRWTLLLQRTLYEHTHAVSRCRVASRRAACAPCRRNRR